MKSSKFPIQSTPVERTITGASMSNRDGVEASGIWDVIKTVGGVIGGLPF